MRALAAVATDVLGRPVHAERVTLADWAAGPAAALPEQARADLVAMFRAYDATGLVGRSDELTELLGRTPTTWAQLLVEPDTTTERSTT